MKTKTKTNTNTKITNNTIKYNKIIAWSVLTLSVCAMIFFGYKLREIGQTYHIGEEAYKDLAAAVRPGGPPVLNMAPAAGHELSSAAKPEAPGEQEKFFKEVPYMNIDFGALQKINPDAVAWLYSPDTPIDYPVVRAKDYDYYLRHLPDGTYNANGTLFIDYNWADFTDQLTIIYGHNMKSKSELMFGSLANYKKQAYFEAHPYMYLYTDSGENYRVELMYGCVIGEGQWRDRAFMFDVNLDAFMAYAAQNTTFLSEVEYTQGEKIAVLSTCSDEFDGARYVLMGVMR